MSSIFVLLEGYEDVVGEPFRRAFSLTRGVLHPFGKMSWMDDSSVRIM